MHPLNRSGREACLRARFPSPNMPDGVYLGEPEEQNRRESLKNRMNTGLAGRSRDDLPRIY